MRRHNLLGSEKYTINSDADVLNIDDKFGKSQALRRILRIVWEQAGGPCNVTVEKEVHCRSFHFEHSSVHGKYFGGCSSNCTRLHFSSQNGGQAASKYLGFCTLRPRPMCKIAHATIAPPHGDERDVYCLCNHTFLKHCTENEGATAESIQGFPFVQQDGVYDCCAHVALLSMNWVLADAKLAERMSLEDIVNRAREIPSTKREVPSGGLDVIQIAHVIKAMGLAPIVYKYPKAKDGKHIPAEHIIYHYVESCLPVLIGIPTGHGGHALLVIGHKFSTHAWWPLVGKHYYKERPSGHDYYTSTDWIQEFIVSDDNLGPYFSVPSSFFKSQSEHSLLIVAPVPDTTLLKAEDAELAAHNLLLNDELIKTATDAFKEEDSAMFWSKHLWQHFIHREVVIRTFLLSSQDGKRAFKEGDYPKEIVEEIETLPLPDRVWYTEFSTPGTFAQRRRVLGRAVLDPTGDPRVFQNPLLVRHVPGIVDSRNVKSDEVHRFLIPDDKPQSHFVRDKT